jgi:hypothetical protein
MRISFSTGTFYQRGLGYSLGLAGEAGYDGVELALGPELSFRGVRGLQRTAHDYPASTRPLCRCRDGRAS